VTDDRNYPENKLQENVTSEIMQVVLNETRESYAEEIIVVLSSSGKEDGEMDENVRRVDEWASQWVKDHVEEEDQA
jgi:adenylate kinase